MTIQANRGSLHSKREKIGSIFGHSGLLALIFLMSVTCCLHVRAAGCSPAVSGVVGWWPGDGNPGDIVGTNNGALLGGATASGVGLVGSAFTFDGTNSYVQFADSAVFHPANLTIEAWVRFSGLDSAGSGGSPAGD